MQENPENSVFDLASTFVLYTDRHIFLTGRAGTGKTTFLKHIKEQAVKKAVIVAPTGVAAINAGGVTIHSFFQLPLGSFIPGRQKGFSTSPSQGTDLQTILKNIRFNRDKRKLLEELELLIIDEVSMLRADALDAMDGILRHFRKRFDQPFGGVQVLYIGDLYQLPPVVSNDEWTFLSQYYRSMFFFDALVMNEARPMTIELDKIYRQSDERFISLLNNIRNNTVSEDDLARLNKYYDPYFYPDPDEGYIILTSHNFKADKINQAAIEKLNSEARTFEGELNGDFNENALPVDKSLVLKTGAQIMFMRNDKGDQRRFYNGKIGVVSRIKDQEIYVRFPGEQEELLLERETWRNIRYHYNEGADKIEEEELGSYKQYPVRLAWAVTIHKSQGLTFEKAIVDAGQSFAAGQVYVALSRLRSLGGLVLTSEIGAGAIHTDPRIVQFSQASTAAAALPSVLDEALKEYAVAVLLKSFNWDKQLEAFRQHHDTWAAAGLPHHGEAIEWSAAVLRTLAGFKETGDKFAVQLRRLVHSGASDQYQGLRERVYAASSYFEKEIREQVMATLQKHMEVTRVKAKAKRYLNSLLPLQLQITAKQQRILQAKDLADGMASGTKLEDLFGRLLGGEKNKAGSHGQQAPKLKEDSKTISLQLLKQGKAPEQIATERGLALSTVEGHLLAFIATGEVRLDQLISGDKERLIREAIARSDDRNIALIRTEMGNSCSYNEIKAVLLQVQREGGNN